MTFEETQRAIGWARQLRSWARNCVSLLESDALSDGDARALLRTLGHAVKEFDKARRRRDRRIGADLAKAVRATRPRPIDWFGAISLDGPTASWDALRSSVERADRFLDLAEHVRTALANPNLDPAERALFERVVEHALDTVTQPPEGITDAS